MADEIIQIADAEPDASKARNRIQARQWAASKLKPGQYGDTASLKVTGGDGPPVRVSFGWLPVQGE